MRRTVMADDVTTRSVRFLSGALTKPSTTFAAVREVRFWRAAYVLWVVGVALDALGLAVHDEGGGAVAYLPLLFSPLVAVLPLVIALLVSRVALAVARERGGDGDYAAAASQTAIVTAVWGLPASLVQLALGPGPAMALTSVSLVAYVYLAYLYSAAYRVSVARGLGGAVIGTLAFVAGVVSVAVVVVVALMAAGIPVP